MVGLWQVNMLEPSQARVAVTREGSGLVGKLVAASSDETIRL